MGGPLSQPLFCGEERIKTYFSERQLEQDDEQYSDLQYVEIISNDEQTDDEYARYRFFTHLDDLKKIQNILNLDDNVNYQCKSNSMACFDTQNSFTNLVDVIYFVEEIFDITGKPIGVHEGKKVFGKKQGLMRLTDVESVSLEWFDNNL